MESLMSVVETLIMAIVISMVIIRLFFGDIKASLIVGSSIPISILAAFILMNLMGFSLNIITMSALTLGVGMMVDNSIVVLESCFRATAGKRAGLVEPGLWAPLSSAVPLRRAWYSSLWHFLKA